MSQLAIATWQNGAAHENGRALPVFADVDVVVAGGGMSAAAAAIAAARLGSRTILLESGGFLGGLLPGCLAEVVEWPGDQSGREVLPVVGEATKKRLIPMGGATGPPRCKGQHSAGR